MDEQDMGETPAGGAGNSGIDSVPGAAEASAGAASRVHNLVHLLPVDWSSVGSLVRPLLDRAGAESNGVQLLILTDEPDQALAVAESVFAGGTGKPTGGILPVTHVGRAARLFNERMPAAVACSVDDARRLIASSALKLQGLRTLLLAWPHESLASSGSGSALESVMAEVPREASRILVAAQASAELESFVERYMRRARRVEERADAEPLPRPIEFVTAGSKGRAAALRTVLDEIDPASVVVRVDEPGELEVEASGAMQLLGLESRESVRLATGETVGEAELAILYGLPSSREVLAEVVESATGRVVVLVEPREIAALRRLAGGQAQPYLSPVAPRRAQDRRASLMAELESRIESESFDGEVLALEPLLETREAVEVAAALLRMLADERVRTEVRSAERAARSADRVPAAAAGLPVSGSASPPDARDADAVQEWTRVFMNVGERDGASPGDLVGAITGEAGVKRDVIGRIDFRDRFAIVEIAAGVADQVIERITGATIRGRQVNARVDRGAGERPGGDRARGRPSFGRPDGGRTSRGFDRGGRGGGTDTRRGFERGGRGREGGEGGVRGRSDRGPGRGGQSFARGGGGGGGDRHDRPGGGGGGGGGGGYRERDRGYGRTQDDERREWRLRGERLRRSRAAPDDRPSRREDEER